MDANYSCKVGFVNVPWCTVSVICPLQQWQPLPSMLIHCVQTRLDGLTLGGFVNKLTNKPTKSKLFVVCTVLKGLFLTGIARGVHKHDNTALCLCKLSSSHVWYLHHAFTLHFDWITFLLLSLTGNFMRFITDQLQSAKSLLPRCYMGGWGGCILLIWE